MTIISLGGSVIVPDAPDLHFEKPILLSYESA